MRLKIRFKCYFQNNIVSSLKFSSVILFTILHLSYSNLNAMEYFEQKDSMKIKQKNTYEKISKGFQKGLWFLTYLNYNDKSKYCFDTLCNPYEAYEGRRIRTINIKILEPFGTDVYDLKKRPEKKVQEIANNMQLATREWVVKMDVFLKEGELLDPQLVYDTEKQLWEDRYFKDVRILLKEVGDDEVDIDIVVQDRWSFGIESSVEVNRLRVGLRFGNLFGIPQELKTFVALNYNRSNIYSVSGSYRYRNIKRSRIDLMADVTYSPLQQSYELSAFRNYFSSKSKWAFSASFAMNDFKNSVTDVNNRNVPTGGIKSLRHDYWASLALPLKKTFLSANHHSRFMLGFRFTRNDFLSRPFVRDVNFADVYLNSYSSVFSIGISNWDFHVDENVYFLGAKEYFPKGLSLAVLGGTSGDEELDNRFYSGFYFNYGLPFKKKAGFLNLNSTYGGYVTKGYYDQISWRIRAHYFTDKFKVGRAFFRQVVRLQTIMSFSRPTGREINLNGGLGFNELRTPDYRGNHSLVLRIEEDFIADFKVLGFSSTLFFFANIGLVSKYDLRPFMAVESSQLLGFGLRLRNVSVGMDLIELSLGYYPSLPKGLNHVYFGTDFTNRNVPRETFLFNSNHLMLDL